MTDQRNKKRAAAEEENEESPHIAGKRSRTPTNLPEIQENQIQKEEDDMLFSWLCIDDDDDSADTDLSQFLVATAAPPPPKITFSGNPYSSSLVFNSSSAYVTINGNDETCGSSFSESVSSVMASVHFGGVWRRPTWDQLLFPAVGGGAWVARAGEEVGLMGEWSGGGGDWVDGYDYDDMLAKFLGEDFMESQ